MNYLKSQFPNPNDVFALEGGLAPVEQHSSLLTWLASRPSTAIIQNAMQRDLAARCEAQLAYNELQRVGLISAAEAQLAKDNPQAAERFKAYADAYTMKVLYRMVGGDKNYGG